MTRQPVILFVDDDTAVLSSIRRMLHPMRNEWKMVFAPGGIEALEVMELEHVDVVVSDMRMPGMNGAQLLGRIKGRHPDAARIILSGHSERTLSVLAINVAHQFLNKPCSYEELSQVIKRTLSLRDILSRPKLTEMVNGIVRMPSLPRHYMAITQELQSSEPSMEKIASIISEDPAMTAVVLHLVNTGFFGLATHFSTVMEAVGMIGTELLRHLVLATSIFSCCSGRAPFSIESFTQRALLIALQARNQAREAGASASVAEMSFVGGLLCDLGILLLATNLSDVYPTILRESEATGTPVEVLEAERLGASHCEIGAYLMGLWGFNDDITEAIALHHKPAQGVPGTVPAPVLYVHAAVCLIDEFLQPGKPAGSIDMDYLARYAMADRIDTWRTMAQETVTETP